jgi:hypothetical protein
MSDNIFVLQESSSEYETSSSEEEEEHEVKVVKTDNMKFYEHTNYVDNTLKVLPVVIKVESSVMTNSNTEFSVTFSDPIIIHKICDIYLDNIVTFKCLANNNANQISFLLDIKELDIKTKSSDSNMKDKIVIPNGSTSVGTTTHKNKKMNFISSIHPKVINTFSGSLTLVDGTSHIWNSTSDGVFTMELNFIFRN